MKVEIATRRVGTRSNYMTYCIWHPKKKARIWSGHLHVVRKSVTVGFCSEACSNSGIHGVPQVCEGCFGSFSNRASKSGRFK